MALRLKYYLPHCVICIALGFTLFKASSLFHNAPSEVYFTLDAKVLADDTFEMFYLTETETAFSQSLSVSVPVTGQPDFQRIEFHVPPSTNVTKIRFDLGNTPSDATGNETIDLREISFNNASGRVTLSGDSLVAFFHPNYCIAAFSADGVIRTQLYNTLYDPFIVSDDISSIVSRLNHDAPVWFLAVSMTLFVALSVFVFLFVPPVVDYPSLIKVGFIMVFFAAILIPGITNLLKIDSGGELLEKRQLAEMPHFEFSKAFARKFETFFTDNFGWRGKLIGVGGRVKADFFNTSLNPERVMMGKKGWIFYNNSGGADMIFGSYTHSNLLDEKQLAEEAAVLEQRKKSCEESGIVYIKAFCPQTQTIYPENMPFLMKLQIRDTLSKADEMIKYLKQTGSDFKIIDLRPALFSAKAGRQIYRKLDSHWNDYGAFIAYQSLFDQCYDRIGVKPKSIEDFTITWVRNGGGDLVNLLASNSSEIFMDTVPVFTPKNQEITFEEISAEGYPARTVVTRCAKCTDRRKLVVFRDSYSESLVQFISAHFYEVVYLWWGYKQESVDQVKPDIVIEIPVERYF